MAERSPYDVIGVAPTAEPEVVEAAYRSLMKKYHPDRTAGAADGERRAAEINAAYFVLRDSQRRCEYDRREAARRHAAAAGPAAVHWAPPPAEAPRRARAVAWSGWAVALMIGCFAATLPMERRIVVTAAAPDLVPAAVTAGFAADSAPPRLPQALEQAAMLPLAPAPPVETPVVAPASTGLQPVLPHPQQSSARPRTRTAAREVRRTASASPRATRRAADRDFLEREDYIY